MTGLLILVFSVFLTLGYVRKSLRPVAFIGAVLFLYLESTGPHGDGMFFMVMSLTFAFTYITAMRHNLKSEHAFLLVLSSIYAVAVLFQIFDLYILHKIPFTYTIIQSTLEKMSESMVMLKNMENISIDATIKFQTAYAVFTTTLPLVAPYLLFVFVLVYVVTAMVFLSKKNIRKDAPFKEFLNWAWEDLTIYILIIGWFVYIIGREWEYSFLVVLGLNTRLISESLFLIQGIAIISFWFHKHKFPVILQVLFYIPIFILRPVQVFFGYLGAFDTWFDFRGMKKEETKNESHIER